MKKPAKELKVTLNSVRITGTSYLVLHDGEETSITMEETTLPIEKATRENILAKVNDAGFGCREIIAAILNVDYIYIDDEGNYLIRDGYPIESKESEIKLIGIGDKINGSN